jgi:hypothetical protein
MTVKLDNSAGRLHELLNQAKSTPDGSGLNVWGRVFGVATQQNLTPEMEVQTLEHIIQLRMLIDQSQREIGDIGDDDPSALANLIQYAPVTIKVISAVAPYVPLLMPGDPNAVPPVL